MNNIKNKRILITGITGFLGSRLAARLLHNNNTVAGLIRTNSGTTELARLDIRNSVQLLELDQNYGNIDKLIEKANPDLVIHTASASREREDENGIRNMVSANILYPSLLLEAMNNNNIKKFINIGTSWQAVDGSIYRPFNYYAATKQSFENVVDHYCLNHHLVATTVRLFDTYGPSDPRPKILNLIIKHTINGIPLDMSPGHQKLHIVHIDDVINALLKAATIICEKENNHHYKYDLISESAITLREIATIAEKVLCKKCPINWGGREYRSGEIMNPKGSNEPIPGYAPSVSLEDGIRQVIEHINI